EMTIDTISKLGVALALLGIAALPARAQSNKPPHDKPANGAAPDKADRLEHLFKKLDKNKDGKIEFDEAHSDSKFEKEAFDVFDTNHDGSLSKEELREGIKNHKNRVPEEWNKVLESKKEQAHERKEEKHEGGNAEPKKAESTGEKVERLFKKLDT